MSELKKIPVFGMGWRYLSEKERRDAREEEVPHLIQERTFCGYRFLKGWDVGREKEEGCCVFGG
jgi:hypothetical protein